MHVSDREILPRHPIPFEVPHHTQNHTRLSQYPINQIRVPLLIQRSSNSRRSSLWSSATCFSRCVPRGWAWLLPSCHVHHFQWLHQASRRWSHFSWSRYSYRVLRLGCDKGTSVLQCVIDEFPIRILRKMFTSYTVARTRSISCISFLLAVSSMALGLRCGYTANTTARMPRSTLASLRVMGQGLDWKSISARSALHSRIWKCHN